MTVKHLVFLLCCLMLGYWVAGQVNQVLDISLQAKQLPGAIPSGTDDEVSGRTDRAKPPALPLRLVETGGVGVPALESDYAGGEDYSHHSGAFKDVIRVDPPFIDEANFERSEREFKAFVQRMLDYGYNGIVINGFLEYVNFDAVGDGLEIYAADSVYRQRHVVLRERFGELFRYASDAGMKVILRTDMLALTGPLEAWLNRQFGGIDASDPALWETYEAGFAELFAAWPFVDGIMIRIGEAGHFANLPGWDYYSSLHITTDTAVRNMLESFTAVAGEWGKDVIFRTWSVGVGEVGDMHTNPDTYQRVLGGIDAPNLVVSTKYSMGDFYSYQSVNPTLQAGDHRRIVEMQARLEFEGMGAFFNDIGPLHQAVLRELLNDNPNIEGIWTWTQEGGPIRAGPMIIYPQFGFWQPTDLNVFSAGKLARDPGIDLGRVNRQWIRNNLSANGHTIENLAEMIALSRKAVTQGLYIGEFAQWKVRALGLEPPPMMWIFEWDLVSGSSSVLSMIHFAAKQDLEAAIAEGFEAVETTRRMQVLVADTDPADYHDPALFNQLSESLAYQADLFEALAEYRRTFLLYYDWLATGNASARREWREALDAFTAALEKHRRKYGNDLAFPAYDFSAAETGMAHARNSIAASWLARLVLLGIGLALLGGTRPVQKRLPFGKGKNGLRALWLGATRPAELHGITFDHSMDKVMATAFPLALIIMGWLAFTSGLSGSFILLKSVALAVFLLTLLWLNRRTGFLPFFAGVMGASLLLAALLALVVAMRGPQFFWYQFWTNPAFNSVFITVSVAASCWLYLVVYEALRSACAHSRATALGHVLIALGAALLAVGSLLAAVGLEAALTALNNGLAILPLGLSRILGITVHLGIPTSIPWLTAVTGAFVLAAGAVVAFLPARTQRLPT